MGEAGFVGQATESVSERYKAQISAINATAQRCSALQIALLAFAGTIFILVAGTTHEMLLRSGTLQLPLFNVGVPITTFYFIAPILFVLMHVNLLNKLWQLHAQIEEVPRAFRPALKPSLWPFDVSLLFGGFAENRLERGVLGLIVLSTLVLMPPLLLIFIQYQFLPYHSELITWANRLCVLADLAALWVFTRTIIGSWRLQELGAASVFATVAALVMSGAVFTVPLGALDNGLAQWIFRDAENNFYLKRNIVFLENAHGGVEPDTEDPIVITGRNLSFADIPNAYLIVGKHGSPPVLAHADLSESEIDFVRPRDYAGADWRGARFPPEVDLEGAKLRKAQLQGADLKEAQLQGVDLREAQLQGAALWHAQLQDANLKEAQLQGAYLEEAQLQGAALQEAQLQGAFLEEAQLQGALLWKAELQGAFLDEAQLQGAYLKEAQLQGAVLDRAKLQGADFREAEVDTPADWAAIAQMAETLPVNWSRRSFEARLSAAQSRSFSREGANLRGALPSGVAPFDWKEPEPGVRQEELFRAACGSPYAAETISSTNGNYTFSGNHEGFGLGESHSDVRATLNATAPTCPGTNKSLVETIPDEICERYFLFSNCGSKAPPVERSSEGAAE